MKKKVKDGERVTTFLLDGTECSVTFSRDFPVFEVRAENDVIVALESGKTAEDDGVILCEGGCSITYTHKRSIDTVYITGTGKVTVVAREEPAASFNILGKGGDVTAQGNPVTINGLQEGVPFSEVAVRMKGKNLFWGSLIVGMISTSDGKLVTTTKNYLSTKDFIEVTPNTVYTLSNTEGISYHAVFFYDNDKQFIGYFINPDYEYISFTAPASCRYIKWRYRFETTDAKVDMITNIQLEQGDTVTEYVPPVTGHELTVNANGVDYTIIPDSNPYIVPTEIYQQSGNNTLSVSGEGEPTLSVTGIRKNAAVRRIWDKLNELTTTIIVSNGEI